MLLSTRFSFHWRFWCIVWCGVSFTCMQDIKKHLYKPIPALSPLSIMLPVHACCKQCGMIICLSTDLKCYASLKTATKGLWQTQRAAQWEQKHLPSSENTTFHIRMVLPFCAFFGRRCPESCLSKSSIHYFRGFCDQLEL